MIISHVRLFMILSHVKIIAFQLSLFNYRFSVKIIAFKDCPLYNKPLIINRKIHGCLEIPDLFLVLNMISHSFAALTREISCSTLEINLVFPRTHVLFSIYFYRHANCQLSRCGKLFIYLRQFIFFFQS